MGTVYCRPQTKGMIHEFDMSSQQRGKDPKQIYNVFLAVV